MDYSKLSDFEINKLVDERLCKKHMVAKEEKYGASVIVTNSCGATCRSNYCNNPSDAWPIIVENRISIMFDEHPAMATDKCEFDGTLCTTGVEVFNQNPLRAAMICFLMIEEQE